MQVCIIYWKYSIFLNWNYWTSVMKLSKFLI